MDGDLHGICLYVCCLNSELLVINAFFMYERGNRLSLYMRTPMNLFTPSRHIMWSVLSDSKYVPHVFFRSLYKTAMLAAGMNVNWGYWNSWVTFRTPDMLPTYPPRPAHTQLHTITGSPFQGNPPINTCHHAHTHIHSLHEPKLPHL